MIILCFQTNNPGIIIKMSFVGIICVVTLLLLCFVGETVTTTSLDITDSMENVYEDFVGDVASLKLLQLILCRSQKPLCLGASKSSTLNLQFYSQTMSKVFSLFMLFKSTTD